MIPHDPASAIPSIQLAALEMASKAAGTKWRVPVVCPLCRHADVSIHGVGILQGDPGQTGITIIADDGVHQVNGIPGLDDNYGVFTIASCEKGCHFGRIYWFDGGHLYTKLVEVES